jgi:hypothetical protein
MVCAMPANPGELSRLVLSDFATKIGASDGPKSLLEYIINIVSERTSKAITAEDFRAWLEAYPWIIVLDGLDEVPASSNRDQLLSMVRDFWVDAREVNADVLVIATTRPQGYNDDFSQSTYTHYYLVSLSTTRALHYGRRLAGVRHSTDSVRRERIIQRLEVAAKKEATARLMRSPLQVTIMATLVDQIGQPPQDRWRLFERYYDVIYNREMSRDIPAASLLRDYKADIDVIHRWIGLALQLESERVGATDAKLPAQKLRAIVEARLLLEGYTEPELSRLVKRIVEAAANRLVFVVGLQADAAGFEVRSLQEFMAAEAIMDGPDAAVCERLQWFAPLPNWRNVYLFAAGKCFAERQHLRGHVLGICGELNESPDESVKISQSGSLLALDLLEDGAARRQPNFARAIARTAFRLCGNEINRECMNLASAYDSELEAVYKEELTLHLKSDSLGSLGHSIAAGKLWRKLGRMLSGRVLADRPQKSNRIVDATGRTGKIRP